MSEKLCEKKYLTYYGKKKCYNQETLDAIREGEDIISGKIKAKIYDTAEEAIADLLKETETEKDSLPDK